MRVINKEGVIFGLLIGRIQDEIQEIRNANPSFVSVYRADGYVPLKSKGVCSLTACYRVEIPNYEPMTVRDFLSSGVVMVYSKLITSVTEGGLGLANGDSYTWDFLAEKTVYGYNGEGQMVNLFVANDEV